MSYDVAVWVGQRPHGGAAAEEFEARADASEEDESPPGSLIKQYVSELLSRYPEGEDDGVWAMEPVLDDEGGDFLYLTLTVGDRLNEVVALAGELAKRHGLVAYDPQIEQLM